MIRTWTGPTDFNQDSRSGLWQALRERDDRQNFYETAPTREEAAEGLEKFLDDEAYPILPSTRKMLDDHQRVHGVPFPPRWYPPTQETA